MACSSEDLGERNLEYAAQYLGFSPKTFVDTMYNSVLECSADCLKGVFDFLKNHESELMTGSELDSVYQSMLEVLAKKYDDVFDRVQAYLEDVILRVPDSVLLPEDSVHAHYSSEQHEQVRVEANMLEQQIIQERRFQAKLLEELEQIERTKAMIAQFQEEKQRRKNLDQIVEDESRAVQSLAKDFGGN